MQLRVFHGSDGQNPTAGKPLAILTELYDKPSDTMTLLRYSKSFTFCHRTCPAPLTLCKILQSLLHLHMQTQIDVLSDTWPYNKQPLKYTAAWLIMPLLWGVCVCVSAQLANEWIPKGSTNMLPAVEIQRQLQRYKNPVGEVVELTKTEFISILWAPQVMS